MVNGLATDRLGLCDGRVAEAGSVVGEVDVDGGHGVGGVVSEKFTFLKKYYN